MIPDQKKIRKAQKRKNYWRDCEIQLKEEYVIENIVVGQTIIKENMLLDIIVKLNLNIYVNRKNQT